MDKLFFGVDIGGTATKLGAFSQDGRLLDKWEIPTDISENGSHIMPNIAREIIRYAGETENVVAVGVGVPGPVRRDGSVKRCVNLGWGGFNPARDLSAQLEGVPVFAGNDANMAAMGEYWQGGGQGSRNLVFITLGTGVGGGIVLDGRMVYGSAGLGGEIGHVVVNPDEPMPCNCGQYGCLDQTASATGVVRHAKRVLARRREPCHALALSAQPPQGRAAVAQPDPPLRMPHRSQLAYVPSQRVVSQRLVPARAVAIDRLHVSASQFPIGAPLMQQLI